MPGTPPHSSQPSLGSPARKPVFGVAMLMLAVAAIASVGSSSTADTAANLLAVFDTWLRAGWAPAVFLVASIGIGRVFTPAISAGSSEGGKTSHRAVLQLTLGLALMLTIVHGLGVLGMLSRVTAIGLAAIGTVLALHQILKAERLGVRTRMSIPRITPMLFLFVIPLAIGIVAAASPPGWLWDSEFGGFDALSYHLQLPQEWLRLGKITPLEHNVYSFLPSYLESASVSLAHLTLAPMDAGLGDGGGLTAGSGWRAMMPQILHLMITGAAAWAVGVFTTALVHKFLGSSRNDGELDKYEIEKNHRTATFAGWTAAALTLATPWVLVVGTLAYNEMAVVLLGAGAMLAAIDREIKPMTRGVLCAFLVGVACGCKPTAILFVAPPVGILLLAGLPPKTLLPAIGLGMLVGVLTLSPWLIRNYHASGNPVFPAMTGLLGDGHYGSSAIARYTKAHTFDGSMLERLRLLVWTDPIASTNASAVQRFRGFANPQWFLLGPLGVLALGLLSAMSRTRQAGLLLGGALGTQIIAWVLFTHLQSRFLLPCVLVLAPAIGAALAAMLASGPSAKRASGWIAVLIVLAQTGMSAANFAQQRGGSGGGQGSGPNLRLPMGPSIDLGRPYAPSLGAAIPTAFINSELPPEAVVYLLGDSTPFYFDGPVIYNTTYDPWPLGLAISEAPDSPESWTKSLRARGITHVLIAGDELGRLTVSGWIDPAITPDRIAAWVGTLDSALRTWPEHSASPARALYRLGTAKEPTP